MLNIVDNTPQFPQNIFFLSPFFKMAHFVPLWLTVASWSYFKFLCQIGDTFFKFTSLFFSQWSILDHPLFVAFISRSSESAFWLNTKMAWQQVEMFYECSLWIKPHLLWLILLFFFFAKEPAMVWFMCNDIKSLIILAMWVPLLISVVLAVPLPFQLSSPTSRMRIFYREKF